MKVSLEFRTILYIFYFSRKMNAAQPKIIEFKAISRHELQHYFTSSSVLQNRHISTKTNKENEREREKLRRK